MRCQKFPLSIRGLQHLEGHYGGMSLNNIRDCAYKEGLGLRLGSAAGGREVGAGVQRLAAVAAAAKQAAAAAGVVHLVLLPSIHLHPALERVKVIAAAWSNRQQRGEDKRKQAVHGSNVTSFCSCMGRLHGSYPSMRLYCRSKELNVPSPFRSGLLNPVHVIGSYGR